MKHYMLKEYMKKKYRRVLKVQEHVSLIGEPGSVYIGHVSPKSSKAEDISFSIISHMSEQEVSLDQLSVVGCDGTPTNTGLNNGVIRRIQLHVRRLSVAMGYLSLALK